MSTSKTMQKNIKNVDTIKTIHTLKKKTTDYATE